MTPEDAKYELAVWPCVNCGCPKFDHDFGFGGNEDSDCEFFRPVREAEFDKLEEIFQEGGTVEDDTWTLSPSSYRIKQHAK